MSWKVKRGLGLLVIAAIALLVALPLLQADAPDSTLGSAAFVAALLVAGIGFWVALIGGLGLLAWGLLRD